MCTVVESMMVHCPRMLTLIEDGREQSFTHRGRTFMGTCSGCRKYRVLTFTRSSATCTPCVVREWDEWRSWSSALQQIREGMHARATQR